MPREDLDRAEERIQVICEKIRCEVLDPAKLERDQILQEAHEEAEAIKEKAHKESDMIFQEMKEKLEEEKRIYQASLEQASKQTVNLVKEHIDKKLFHPALREWLQKALREENELSSLVEVIVRALEKKGLDANLSLEIPQGMEPKAILSKLSKDIVKRLQEEDVEVSKSFGGMKVSMKDSHMSLDFSGEAIEEMIASFLRKEFRKIFFQA